MNTTLRPHGLMFHHFHDDGDSGRHPAGQGSISADQLREMIEFVGRDRILPAREWLRRAVCGRLKDRDVCLTFDDNLRCQFDVALPVLREMKLTAFWFVYTSVLQGNIEPLEIYRAFRMNHFDDIDAFYDAFFETVERSSFARDVERAMPSFDPATYLAAFPFYTESDRRFRFVRDEVLGPKHYHATMGAMLASAGVDVKDLAKHLWMDDACLRELHHEGHVIGLHSHTHPTRVAKLAAKDQEREYTQNFEHLLRLLGAPPLAMSHPCNSYDERTLKILRKLGIQLGFRSNMAQTETSDDLTYPREDHANVLARMKEEMSSTNLHESSRI